MAIQNGERLTQPPVELANRGLQSHTVNVGEKNDLADYLGLGVRTVERWFAPPGSKQHRRCLTRESWLYKPPPNFNGSQPKPGHRVIFMFDDDNPSGEGDGLSPKLGGGYLQHMRFRAFLTICLGMAGGLERQAIFTGAERLLEIDTASLSETLDVLNKIYIGEYSAFMERAWIVIEIEPRFPAGWRLVVKYDDPLPGEESDEEAEPPEETE